MKLYGKNPVIERLRSNPQSIRKLAMEHGFSEASFFSSKARKWGIPVLNLPKSKMQKICRNINSQGVFIEVDDFEYVMYPDLLEQARKSKRILVFLDELNDPQNLGAILRALGCLGKYSLVLPTKKSVSVTETVLRIASGAENYVQIAQVSNLAQAIKKAKEENFFIAGAVAKGGQSLHDVQFQYPLALVIGSEQKGIRDVIVQLLDLTVTIPMALEHLSLNVAHAASIICYEISKQKKQSPASEPAH